MRQWNEKKGGGGNRVFRVFRQKITSQVVSSGKWTDHAAAEAAAADSRPTPSGHT